MSPDTTCSGESACVSVSLNRLASISVISLGSELRREMRRLSLGFLLWGFLGLAPNTMRLVLWELVRASPFHTATTTTCREEPRESQHSLSRREVRPFCFDNGGDCVSYLMFS